MKYFITIAALAYAMVGKLEQARSETNCEKYVKIGRTEWSVHYDSCVLGMAIFKRFEQRGIAIQEPADIDFFAGDCVIDHRANGETFHEAAYNVVVLVKKEKDGVGFDIFDSPLSNVANGQGGMDELEEYLKQKEIREGFSKLYGNEEGYKRISKISLTADNTLTYSLKFTAPRTNFGLINRRNLKRNSDNVHVLRIDNLSGSRVKESQYCLLKKVLP